MSVDDKIGRSDSRDKVQTTSVVASGTATLLPESPLGRRNYIQVKNIGAVDVVVLSSASVATGDGFIVKASGGEWSDTTDAELYIKSTGANSEVRVYERASRFNYK